MEKNSTWEAFSRQNGSKEKFPRLEAKKKFFFFGEISEKVGPPLEKNFYLEGPFKAKGALRKGKNFSLVSELN